MIISHKLKIIFIHIPKNAGTFMTQKLVEIDNSINLSKHLLAKDLKGFFLRYQDYKKFAIIRNPYSRCVSYYSFIQQTKGHFLHKLVKNKTFKEFLEYELITHDRVDDEGYFLQNAIEDQCDFVIDNDGSLLIDNILRFENIEEDLKLLFKDEPLWQSANINFGKINESKHDDYKKYYNEELIKLVQIIFKKDFEYFNFDYNL